MRRNLLLTLACCVAVAASVAAAATARSGSAQSSGWQRSDLKPITQPAAIAGRFVFYNASHGRLSVMAVDAQTGKTVWSRPATGSEVTAGVSAELDVLGNSIFVLLPSSIVAHGATVARLDAQTGKVLWQSVPSIFYDWPAPCPGDATAVCASGIHVSRGGNVGLIRFRASDGKPLSVVTLGSLGARQLGDGLYDLAQRSPELIAGVAGSSISWKKKTADLFGKGASSDNGWNIGADEPDGLFMGSVPGKPLTQTANTASFALGAAQTVGFRISNGSVAWRNAGSYFQCDELLPCPGENHAGYVDQRDPYETPPAVGIRSRETGTLNLTRSPQKSVLSKNARIVIEGFHPDSGRTAWSFDAGRNMGLISEQAIVPLAGAETVLIRGASGGYVVLDLRTGARRAAPASARGWCAHYFQYKAESTTRVAQNTLVPCSVTGKRLSTPSRVPSWLGDFGAESGGLVAWAAPTGLIAAPVQ